MTANRDGCADRAEKSGASPTTVGSNDAPKKVISFRPGDVQNPYNWSTSRKIFIVVIVINTVLNSTFASGITSGVINSIATEFNVKDEEQFPLTTSMYLLGYVLGPLVFAPLSETYGRRILMLGTFAFYTIFTLACALAPNWPALLIFRLLQGIGAASPISVVGGIYADLFDNPVARGRAMACFMAGTVFGPVWAPVVSGYAYPLGWRWAFWIVLIYNGVSIPAVALIPETYGPVILKKRARRLRKEKGDMSIVAPIELEKKGARDLVTRILTRPIRMFLFEAIVLFTCLFTSFIFGVFYLFYEAYPLIFQGLYGRDYGDAGLAFIPICIGSTIACGVFLVYEKVHTKAEKAGKPWALLEEYRRLPLACIGGPAFAISLFWLGWAANADVHWIVPALAGIPCGFGYTLLWMAFLNYLTDAYAVFSASALAANATTRSIFGVCLPFAANPMYKKLGIHWATSLLGFVAILLSIIPFIFVKYGAAIRARSKFCQALQKMRAEEDARRNNNGPDDGESSPSTSGILEEKEGKV